MKCSTLEILLWGIVVGTVVSRLAIIIFPRLLKLKPQLVPPVQHLKVLHRRYWGGVVKQNAEYIFRNRPKGESRYA